MSDITDFLLQTGPIKLADFVTRKPEFATRLGELKALKTAGIVKLNGAVSALDELYDAVEQAKVKAAGKPALFTTLVQKSLKDVPEAKSLVVLLSQSAFGKAIKA